MWKASGKKPKQLEEQPTLPEELWHLWEWFLELNNPGELTFQEIESWSRLTCRNVTSTEAQVLRKLDRLYMEVINGRRDSQSNHQGPKRPSRNR